LLKVRNAPRIWQFCYELLENETYNPLVIKWINKEEGIFEITKPDQVAELWGLQKKRKNKMTYEGMSRGIRYFHKLAPL
jgi:hypothetical protein